MLYARCLLLRLLVISLGSSVVIILARPDFMCLAFDDLFLDKRFGHNIVALYFDRDFLFLEFRLRDSSLGESLQVGCEQDGVRPACFFAPKLPEEVTNGNVCGCSETNS